MRFYLSLETLSSYLQKLAYQEGSICIFPFCSSTAEPGLQAVLHRGARAVGPKPCPVQATGGLQIAHSFYFPTCLRAQSSEPHPQTRESTQFSMQCFPPEKHVSPRQMFCVHCICTPAPSPSQLSSPCTACAPPCSTALFPGQDLGQVANQVSKTWFCRASGTAGLVPTPGTVHG